MSSTPILDVRDLETHFFTDAGVVRAVDGVTFSVGRGETLGIVGESGSGKSITARSLMRLLDDNARIVDGAVTFQGRDVLKMTPEELRDMRGNAMSMVFQDPMTSLNPVLRIAKQMAETMVTHGRFDEPQAIARSVSLLGRMGITAPERAINSYPHQFSGGMRQRVMLAIGFSNEPALLIADEPTTALDVTIQAQILDLLAELNRDYRHLDHPDQPRARRDRECVPARAGDVCGRDRRGRADGAGAGRSAASLHLGADQRDPARRP